MEGVEGEWGGKHEGEEEGCAEPIDCAGGCGEVGCAGVDDGAESEPLLGVISWCGWNIVGWREGREWWRGERRCDIRPSSR